MPSQILVLHQLPLEQLNSSLDGLRCIYPGQQVSNLLLSDDINQDLACLQASDVRLLSLHLRLDKEISCHKLISSAADTHNLEQVNPYDDIAELCDDKYKFYEFMLANEFLQAKTSVFNSIPDLDSSRHCILKPRHGTESRDVFSSSEIDIASASSQILDYDDLIVQDFIEHEAAYRVLYINKQLFSNKAMSAEFYKYSMNFIAALRQSFNKEPGIISFDLLETAAGPLVLEANIRPAAIAKFSECLI